MFMPVAHLRLYMWLLVFAVDTDDIDDIDDFDSPKTNRSGAFPDEDQPTKESDVGKYQLSDRCSTSTALLWGSKKSCLFPVTLP